VLVAVAMTVMVVTGHPEHFRTDLGTYFATDTAIGIHSRNTLHDRTSVKMMVNHSRAAR
jgi:hypothetical protein